MWEKIVPIFFSAYLPRESDTNIPPSPVRITALHNHCWNECVERDTHWAASLVQQLGLISNWSTQTRLYAQQTPSFVNACFLRWSSPLLFSASSTPQKHSNRDHDLFSWQPSRCTAFASCASRNESDRCSPRPCSKIPQSTFEIPLLIPPLSKTYTLRDFLSGSLDTN